MKRLVMALALVSAFGIGTATKLALAHAQVSKTIEVTTEPTMPTPLVNHDAVPAPAPTELPATPNSNPTPSPDSAPSSPVEPSAPPETTTPSTNPVPDSVPSDNGKTTSGPNYSITTENF